MGGSAAWTVGTAAAARTFAETVSLRMVSGHAGVPEKVKRPYGRLFVLEENALWRGWLIFQCFNSLAKLIFINGNKAVKGNDRTLPVFTSDSRMWRV